MDLGSIEKRSRHIMDVHRIHSDFEDLTPEQVDAKLEEQKTQAAIRWEACLKSYAGLFMMLNRGNGNKMPSDSFDIRVKHEELGGATYDAYVRVWRDRRDRTYHARPYIDCGHGIVDSEFETEHFGGDYKYSYGTHHSKFARIHVEYEGLEPEIRLERLDGKLVGKLTDDKQKAIFLAALENSVMPGLDDTEDTLAMLTDAILDDGLNPELARRARLPKH